METTDISEPEHGNALPASKGGKPMQGIAARVAVGFVYLAGSIAVLLFGSSYFSLFRTNKSRMYRTALVPASIGVWWLIERFTENGSLELLAVGFIAAASANLAGWAISFLHKPLRISDESVRRMAVGKALEALAVVTAISVVFIIWRPMLVDVSLAWGRVPLGLALGLGGFALFAVAAGFQARSLKIERPLLVRSLAWMLLFCLSNAFMEELWFRALFLKPLAALLGPIAAIFLTGAVFAVLHIGATYMSSKERIRFLMMLFPLGIVWGVCMHVTGSLLASTLFHAGADLLIINGFLQAFAGAGKLDQHPRSRTTSG